MYDDREKQNEHLQAHTCTYIIGSLFFTEKDMSARRNRGSDNKRKSHAEFISPETSKAIDTPIQMTTQVTESLEADTYSSNHQPIGDGQTNGRETRRYHPERPHFGGQAQEAEEMHVPEHPHFEKQALKSARFQQQAVKTTNMEAVASENKKMTTPPPSLPVPKLHIPRKDISIIKRKNEGSRRDEPPSKKLHVSSKKDGVNKHCKNEEVKSEIMKQGQIVGSGSTKKMIAQHKSKEFVSTNESDEGASNKHDVSRNQGVSSSSSSSSSSSDEESKWSSVQDDSEDDMFHKLTNCIIDDESSSSDGGGSGSSNSCDEDEEYDFGNDGCGSEDDELHYVELTKIFDLIKVKIKHRTRVSNKPTKMNVQYAVNFQEAPTSDVRPQHLTLPKLHKELVD
jgi:hypothetical protein